MRLLNMHTDHPFTIPHTCSLINTYTCTCMCIRDENRDCLPVAHWSDSWSSFFSHSRFLRSFICLRGLLWRKQHSPRLIVVLILLILNSSDVIDEATSAYPNWQCDRQTHIAISACHVVLLEIQHKRSQTFPFGSLAQVLSILFSWRLEQHEHLHEQCNSNFYTLLGRCELILWHIQSAYMCTNGYSRCLSIFDRRNPK